LETATFERKRNSSLEDVKRRRKYRWLKEIPKLSYCFLKIVGSRTFCNLLKHVSKEISLCCSVIKSDDAHMSNYKIIAKMIHRKSTVSSASDYHRWLRQPLKLHLKGCADGSL